MGVIHKLQILVEFFPTDEVCTQLCCLRVDRLILY